MLPIHNQRVGGVVNAVVFLPNGEKCLFGKIFLFFCKKLLTNGNNSDIISFVRNIGASPSGKASDSDSDITGVRIPVPQPNKNPPNRVDFLFGWGNNEGIRSSEKTLQWSVFERWPKALAAHNLKQGTDVRRQRQEESPCPSQQKTHFCLPTKVRFLN